MLAAQFAVTAYVPAFVGAVKDPLYLILLEAPPPKQLTVAVRGDPLYVTGEFVTDADAAIELITKLPAERPVPELKFAVAAQFAVTAYVPAFVGTVAEPA